MIIARHDGRGFVWVKPPCEFQVEDNEKLGLHYDEGRYAVSVKWGEGDGAFLWRGQSEEEARRLLAALEQAIRHDWEGFDVREDVGRAEGLYGRSK